MAQTQEGNKDIEEILAGHPLFQMLSDDAREDLVSKSDFTSLKQGDKLIEQGEFNYHLYLIREGVASVIMHDETVGELQAGDVAGEISTSGLSTPVADVIAKTDLEVIAFPIEDINDIAFEHPEFSEKMREIGMERLGH